jgi:sigma-B regulation protein RsbQ
MNKDIFTRNNVNRYGKGSQPMMFAHGYGCDQNMWRFVAPAFEDDYEIILFDHTGSGKSDAKAYDFNKYNSLEGYADDIIEICDELKLKDVIFVAHSVSTMMSVIAAARRPDLFAKLILIGPSPRYINDDNYFGGFAKNDIDDLIETLESNYLGWSSAITPVIIGNPDKPEMAEELHNSFCRMNPEIAKHFARVTFLSDNRVDLPKVSVPSLVIQCDPDMISPVEVGKYVDEQLQNSSFVQINTSGHCPHLTAPELTINAIKTFLKRDN